MQVVLGVGAFVWCKLARVCWRKPPVTSIDGVDALPLPIRRGACTKARGVVDVLERELPVAVG
eukprot:1700078-Prorocentrum_lima.AAC.1